MKTKNALISAITNSTKPVAFVLGSPISMSKTGTTIPSVDGIVKIVEEYVKEKFPKQFDSLVSTIADCNSINAYQKSMEWVQSYLSQDHVNSIVQISVKRALKDINDIRSLSELDRDFNAWNIPQSIDSFAKLLIKCKSMSGPILTTNFDPLIAMGLESNNVSVNRFILHADGSIPKVVNSEKTTKNVIHLHGYWHNADTLHSPVQIYSNRPKLQSSIQNLINNNLLIVVAYGGWDDAFKRAVSSLLDDDGNSLDVIWCFYENNDDEVRVKYKNIFDTFAQAIYRGRFRYYLGIDCNTIFEELLSYCNEKCDDKNIDVSVSETVATIDNNNSYIRNLLYKNFKSSLRCYNANVNEWVEPRICDRPEDSENADGFSEIGASELIEHPQDTLIKSYPQFGLTCLSQYLCYHAFTKRNEFWLRIDFEEVKSNIHSINNFIDDELLGYSLTSDDVKGLVIDSWKINDKEYSKCLFKLKERFSKIPFILMQTMDGLQIVQDDKIANFLSEYRRLFLWSLTQNKVRQVVMRYNDVKRVGEDDSVTKRIVSDLDSLNLHRTPLNCITLLKVSEIDFDESPVNRTEIIQRVLFLIFNAEDIPSYKTRPDVKDCEYVLGSFCEKLIRKNNYVFTFSEMMNSLKACCEEHLIEIDIQLMFDILIVNSILIQRGALYSFKYSYWVFYFGAKRMHNCAEFATYILADYVYTKFPEIIEFYTGIDRQRNDAICALIKDIRTVQDEVNQKCGLPDDFTPLSDARWNPSDEQIEKMKDVINNGIQESNLPDSIKDAYSDENYDRKKPYNQDIQTILSESSLVNMMMSMKAGARALRNSDYVDSKLKLQLLEEISRCWNQTSQVILILLPLLAENGRAQFDGAGFILCGDFGDTIQKRINNILSELSANIVRWVQDDIYSAKLVPLFRKKITTETNDFNRHNINILLLRNRPSGWENDIQQYLNSLQKNSFYLYDLFRALKNEYSYGCMNQKTLITVGNLMKMCMTKHVNGIKKPTIKDANRNISDKIFPERKES